jgi:hypothetical protein
MALSLPPGAGTRQTARCRGALFLGAAGPRTGQAAAASAVSRATRNDAMILLDLAAHESAQLPPAQLS